MGKKNESALTPAHAAALGALSAQPEYCENCTGFNQWHSPDSHRINRERIEGAVARQAARDAERKRENEQMRARIFNQEA